MQHRPCFIVIDTEHASSISTRKLVLETAKYNVITAYSCKEGLLMLRRFPGVDAVVMTGVGYQPDAGPLLDALHETPEVKLVVVGDGLAGNSAREPDAVVESFAPPKLLKALQHLFPEEARHLLAHENALERKQV